MATINFQARPPAAAVQYLADKTPNGRLSFDYRDMVEAEHLTSFVVAKMMTRDLLTDTHQALLEAIKGGQTREQFIKGLKPQLQARGWWGKQEATDPLTGEVRKVQLGSSRRLGIIFDTNMRMAHAAGRWQRIQDAKAVLPYLVYSAVLDERTRPLHAAWGGRGGVRIILPVDHPFWLTHYPPNGWRCRCLVMQMSAAMLAARGWTVTSEEALAKTRATQTALIPNRRTGGFDVVPVGIDPGFAYNVGMARRSALTPPPRPEPQRDLVIGERYPRALPKALPPRPFPPDVTRQPELQGDAVFDAFSRTLGVAEGEIYTDAVQIPLVVGRELFAEKTAAGEVIGSKADKGGRGQWAGLLAATIRDPDEIWVAFEEMAAGAPRLSRRYVAAWQDEAGERFWLTAVFAERDGWWFGVTAFTPSGSAAKASRYTDKNGRAGAMVYRREN